MERFNKEKVVELRKKLKMSQATLAYKMGKSNLTVHNIESGHCQLTIKSLCVMANVFGVKISDFFEEGK